MAIPHTADLHSAPHTDVSSTTNYTHDVTAYNTSSYDVTGDVSTVFYPWENPYNLITKETLQIIETVVTCGLSPVLLAVGLPCNVLNCLVFWKQGLADRMNVSLFSLALVDVMAIVLWFLLGSFCPLRHLLPSALPFNIHWWKWTVRKYLMGFHRGFLFSSGCLTMLIAVERCACVLMPLKAATLIKTRTMTSLIIITVTSLHVICLVYGIKFDVVMEHKDGVTLILLPPTRLYRQHRALVDWVEHALIMTLLPSLTFLVVTLATTLTVLRLRQGMAWREGRANNSVTKAQEGVVRMLVVVSCIYIITACPHIIFGVIRSLEPDLWVTGKYRNTYVASHLLYLTLGTLNSSVNFFVYLSRSSRFRQHLLAWLPCFTRLCPSPPTPSDVTTRAAVTSSPALTSG